MDIDNKFECSKPFSCTHSESFGIMHTRIPLFILVKIYFILSFLLTLITLLYLALRFALQCSALLQLVQLLFIWFGLSGKICSLLTQLIRCLLYLTILIWLYLLAYFLLLLDLNFMSLAYLLSFTRYASWSLLRWLASCG